MHTNYLTFHHWAAFSPDRKELGEWAAWALDQSRVSMSPEAPYKAELSGVPPMLRRRLSGMGKAALWCAGQVLEANAGPEAVTRIFCSQHGEVSRTIAMLQDLAMQSPLSPASFSLSVHNAIGGIHSIAGGVEQPVTAIAAGPDSPFAALLEAWSQLKFRQLKGHHSERALCVFYDDALPEDVADPEDRVGDVQGMALLVSCGEPQQKGGDALTLSFTLADKPGDDEVVAEGAAIDTLLKFLMDDTSRNMVFRGDGRCWSWGKHHSGAPQVHS